MITLGANYLNVEVIDWYSYSEDHLWWFVDWGHVNSAGYLARAQQIVDALPR